MFSIAGRSLAQADPSEADRALATALLKLPDADARARIASAESAQITAGLSAALRISVRDWVNRHENSPEALRVLNLAIEVAQRGGFIFEEAEARYAAGSPLNNMGRIDEALESHNRAYDLYKRANAPPEKLVGVFTNRANVHRHLGDYHASLDDNREAERLDRQLEDEVGLARVLNNTGLVYEEMGDYRDAMRLLEQSLEIAVRRKERTGEAYVLNNLAATAMLMGDYAPAATYAQRSLEIKQAVASKEDIVTSLISLGTVYHHAGRDADAEHTLRSAIAGAAETSRKTIKAEALGELGVIEFDRKHYPAAQADFEEARLLYHEGREKVSEAHILGRLARVLLAERHHAEALNVANLARQQARDAGATPELLVPSLVAGQVLRRLNRDPEARAAFEEAIASVEQLRDMVAGGEAERENFLAERSAPYREMTALEVSQGHWAAALAMSERAKARALLDLLSGGREQPGRFMTAAERARESQLRGRIASLGAQLRLVSAQTNPPAQSVDLRARIEKTHADLEDFRLAFYSVHPELGVRRGDVQPIGWRAIAALPSDRKTAILNYAVTTESVYLFVIERERPLVAHRLAISTPALGHLVREFRDQLAARDPNFPAIAARLYQLLIGPAAAELAGKTTWIVAPDGDLWQVPFQALMAPDGRYAIEDAAISYAPSMSVLAALRKSARPPRVAPSFGAFGNPTGDIPESESEVRQVATLYGTASSVWTGAGASEDRFRKTAGDFDVIHIAAHGVFDDRNPLRSRLVFHPPLTKGAEDGWLEADEIRELNLHASLVVLSGCETARGNFVDGEGAIGMAWAFLAAGGRAVLASQWRVESSSTTRLMLKFHSALRSGETKADALRHASLDLLRDDRFRHPFYWAPFELYGDSY
ncbi:MAG TPA: CHAT domain-containing tetratricopeptide repeat protein [Bryobacteraceae bacterium]|nr:CHAT domain-containing tetratricopeptide repeat protein [Bryobacteraceae bacterium]